MRAVVIRWAVRISILLLAISIVAAAIYLVVRSLPSRHRNIRYESHNNSPATEDGHLHHSRAQS